MNIDQIKTECFILALFIREDGERILLGSGEYEFKESQLHFAADSYANDVVEVQGNDGVFLAGQVRRPSSQVFDGYIGDATVRKPKIEEYRRHFLAFFRKNYYYTVVYIFPDGTAIQRRKGFIVDAPEVKELYQVHPEYHIALNFEDVNYYSYSEDESGQETYTKSALINLSTGGVKGGLVWDAVGAVNLPYTWTDPVEFTASDLVINNALDVMVPLEGMELRGDTFQQSYSGKNLLPYPYNWSGNEHGITFTFNNDGTVVLNGQNDGVANSAKYFIETADSPLTLPAGTYYFIPPSVSAVHFTAYDGSSYYLFSSSNNWTYTFNSSVTIRRFYIEVSKGNTAVFNNTKVYPMLSTSPNQTEADYEPYVGGTASPNPDYPQNVNTVTGEQTVSVIGENLFDRRNASENTILTWVAGANNSENGTLVGPYINVNEGDKFISNYTMIVFFYDSSSNYLGVLQDDEGTVAKRAQLNAFNPKSFTVPNGLSIAKMRIEYRKNKGNNPKDMVAVNDIMLNSGTTLLPYSPSQSQVHSLNLGKNLFNTSHLSEQSVATGLNSITLEKPDTRTVNAYFSPRLPAGTYTLSYNVVKGSTNTDGVRCGVYKINDAGTGTERLADVSTYDGHVVFKFTSPTPVDRLYIYINGNQPDGATVDVNNIQVEVGESATEFTPYIEPIELCKLGDYQDYIYKNNGSWYLHKAVGKVVLDGTESWNKVNGAAYNTYYVSNLITALRTDSTHPYLSTYFTPISYNERYKDLTFIINSQNQILMSYNSITTISDFQTWLSSHNISVYYALATPTDTKITDETLLNQLNAIGAMKLFVGQNNISVQSAGSNLPVLLKANYATAVVTAGAGFEWEKGGNGGPTTVMVDSIDRVYPVWRLTGPAVNPQLAVLETGTTLSYTGTITASQTLEIDMFNKTAKLNGTSVIGNVSGDWVYFEPGNNRVTYTTNNADALPSMIYWQEVVG